MAEADLELCLSTALKLAREAGGMIKDAFKKKKNVMLKASPIDLVTETDEAVEKFLFSELRKVFPQHRYIGEESVAAGAKVDLTDAPTWIIDPVDGTMNFVHSFPFTCVSIGELASEHIGQDGAVMPYLSKSLVIGEMGTSPIPEKRECVFENARILVGKAHGYRFLGSAALCMCLLAEGGADVYYTFGVYCWDVAAGCVICREAGGVVLDTADVLVFRFGRPLLCLDSRPADSPGPFRSMGSCALNMCLVASGAAELYHEAGIHCWDVAAGAVVVTEAGGVVIDTAGGEFDLLSRRVLCASSPSLGQEVASLLHQYQPPRD
ncbi:Inositol monophosphatase 1 [Amphibalanus amphitrite]|uniref:Inositol-1-monophosphatase n=1 Tax=Amphibalanus amphitrite TaxID=1232801 RepID=A0A6A4W5D6_AMPAM|nr:Inositol monophosphatase 1 [Amphibalanus amphitrite]